MTTSKHIEILMLNKQNKKTIVVVKLNVSLQANMLTLPDRLCQKLKKNKPLHLRLMSNGSVWSSPTTESILDQNNSVLFYLWTIFLSKHDVRCIIFELWAVDYECNFKADVGTAILKSVTSPYELAQSWAVHKIPNGYACLININ